MKYIDIRTKLKDFPIFSVRDIQQLEPDFRNATLSDWVKKGYIKKIKNEWYAFSDFDPKDFDYFYISNKIYSPSYVSLETMLAYYGVIPEAVQYITAVSTKGTREIVTDYGVYSYRQIQSDLFWGYEILYPNSSEKTRGVSIASLERSILDYFYFNPIKDIPDLEGLRFDKEVLNERLDVEGITRSADRMSVSVVKDRVKLLLRYINA